MNLGVKGLPQHLNCGLASRELQMNEGRRFRIHGTGLRERLGLCAPERGGWLMDGCLRVGMC